MSDRPINQHADDDPQETQEWLEALEAVIARDGPERAHWLLEKLIEKSRRSGAYIPFQPHTAYCNTIPAHAEARSDGDHALEWRIRSLIRWNAMATVVNANLEHEGLGGHIASFASAATLYDVGFNHFFKGPDHAEGPDLVYIQGHCAPGVYARAFLEGRIGEDDLRRFRREANAPGLSSYPHPWLMPDFWQFATVSMGLGPIMAIYQARLMKYLNNREMDQRSHRKVWCYCGDGEMDEPESLGAIDIAAREKLDNLIFVVNCNLQRLDGPVRGDGKIIQELEGVFRGAGWNVIKVVWGSAWDPLLDADHSGKLQQLMDETVDGEYQAFKARGGAYTRKHFFGKYPETARLVERMSDEEVGKLNRGGHDPHKVYAAYHRAVNQNNGRPTVILAKTVKGYGMGEAGEGQNITHQQKKMGEKALKEFRDRFELPITDERIAEAPFYKPPEDSPEIRYLKQRRENLGGYLPQRRSEVDALPIPPLDTFKALLEGTGERKISTTMAFVRLLGTLVRDKTIGSHVVPIVPDEARTFGMEGMFRQLGIYSAVGQKYRPEDADQLAFYKEDIRGQILEEGITEAGSMSSWIAAATSYANHGVPLLPFYIFYSMFGFQRIGDLAWAAGDMRARGFLLGGTAGRTTLNGEGLQHEDGHSHILAATIPNCRSYDATFAYEIAVIVQRGLQAMYGEQQDHYYYLTLENENYEHPAMPEGVEDGIMRGLYPFAMATKPKKAHVRLMGCGAIFREILAAAKMLEEDWDCSVDVWAAPSFTELARDGQDAARRKLLGHKTEITPYVEQCLADRDGPVVAASDYIKAWPEMIRGFVPATFHTLGTDGFGRSDTREELRAFFEVDRRWIVLSALQGLVDDGLKPANVLSKARKSLGISATHRNPRLS
nr:pyruvate dehydrogenase (acetyl-transferring), homodimeric type [Oceanococcus sp. HetDA_MAG_MS8]